MLLKKGLMILMILSMAIFSCTELTVIPLKQAVNIDPVGLVYFLPKSKFDITIDREITGYVCDGLETNYEIKHKITLKNSYIRGDSYLIDYPRLSNAATTTSLSVELYNNGTIKSMNSTLTDESGKIVEAVLSGIVKIASAAIVPTKKGEEIGIICKQDVITNLNDLKTQRDLLSKKEAELEAKKSELNTETDKEKIAQLKKEIEILEKDFKKIKNKISEIEPKLTFSQNITIIPDMNKIMEGGKYKTQELYPPKEMLCKWFEFSKGDCISKLSDNDYESLINKKFIKMKLFIDYYFDSGIVNTTLPDSNLIISKDKSVKYHKGLVYCQPREVLLLINNGECCINEKFEIVGKDEDRLFTKYFNIPQLGLLGLLPLTNEAFQTKTIMASFNEDGSINKFEYTTKSAAEQTAKLLNQTADGIVKISDEKIKINEAKRNEQLNNLKIQAEKAKALLEYQKALKELEDFSNTTEEDESEE